MKGVPGMIAVALVIGIIGVLSPSMFDSAFAVNDGTFLDEFGIVVNEISGIFNVGSDSIERLGVIPAVYAQTAPTFQPIDSSRTMAHGGPNILTINHAIGNNAYVFTSCVPSRSDITCDITTDNSQAVLQHDSSYVPERVSFSFIVGVTESGGTTEYRNVYTIHLGPGGTAPDQPPDFTFETAIDGTDASIVLFTDPILDEDGNSITTATGTVETATLTELFNRQTLQFTVHPSTSSSPNSVLIDLETTLGELHRTIISDSDGYVQFNYDLQEWEDNAVDIYLFIADDDVVDGSSVGAGIAVPLVEDGSRSGSFIIADTTSQMFNTAFVDNNIGFIIEFGAPAQLLLLEKVNSSASFEYIGTTPLRFTETSLPDVMVDAKGPLTDVRGHLTAPEATGSNGEITPKHNARPEGYPVGTHTITWTATDDDRLSVTLQQRVKVTTDNTPPTVRTPTSNILEEGGTLTLNIQNVLTDPDPDDTYTFTKCTVNGGGVV